MVFKSIKKAVAGLSANENGNISILISGSMTLMLLVASIAIDMSTLTSKKQRMQGKLDAATLAAAKAHYVDSLSKKDAKALADSMMKEFTENGDLKCAPVKLDSGSATSKCRGFTQPIMSKLVGKDKLKYSISSSAVAGAGQKYEVSFVFDISSSMVKNVPALEKALNTFISDELFKTGKKDDAVFSLIPYGGSVAFAPSFSGWLQPSERADFSGCFLPHATDSEREFEGDPIERSAPNFYNKNNGNPNCPDQSMAAQFFLEESTSEAVSLVNNIKLSQGTASNEALMWGYRSLLPEMQGVLDDGSSFPRDFDDNHKKVLILMTDGKPQNVRWRVPKGTDNGDDGLEPMERFQKMCKHIKSEGKDIDLYTIGFGAVGNGKAKELEGFLSDCTMGEGKFLSAQRKNLSKVISAILAEQMDVRITN